MASKTFAEMIFKVDAKTKKAERDLNNFATKLRSVRTVGVTTLIGIAASSGVAAASIAVLGAAAALTALAFTGLAALAVVGLIGLGIASAAQAEMIKLTWQNMKDRIAPIYADLMKGWIESTHSAIHGLEEALLGFLPGFGAGMEVARGLFDRWVKLMLTKDIGEQIGTSFAKGMERIRPLMEGLIDMAPGFLTAWIGVGGQITKSLANGEVGILSMFSAIKDRLIPSIGEFLAALIELGAGQGTSFINLLSTTFEALSKTITKLAESDFVTDLMDGLGSFVTSVMNTIDILIESLGPGLGDVLRNLGSIVESLAPTLAVFGSLFEVLAEVVDDTLTAITPLLIRFGEMFQPILEGLKPIMRDFTATTLPKLVAAFTKVFDAVEPLMPVIAKLAGVLLELAAEVLVQVIEGFATFATFLSESGFIEALVKILNWVTDFIDQNKPLIGFLLSFFTSFGLLGKAGKYIGKVLGFVAGIFGKVFKAVVKVIPHVTKFGSGVGEVAGRVAGFIGKMWEKFSSVFTKIREGGGRVMEAFRKVGDFFYKIKEEIVSTMTKLRENFDVIFKAVGDLFNVFVELFKKGGTSIKNGLTSIWEGLQFLKTKWIDIWAGIKLVFEAVVTSLSKNKDKAVAIIDGLWTAIKTVFSGALATMTGFGKDLIQGLMNGIDAMLQPLKNAWNKVVNILPKKFAATMRISSPSKVMADMGKQVMDGLDMGLKVNAGAPVKTMEGAAAAIGGSVPSLSPAGAGGRGSRTQLITVELDGRVLAKALGSSMVDQIRVKTGTRSI
jgi:phage-related protein